VAVALYIIALEFCALTKLTRSYTKKYHSFKSVYATVVNQNAVCIIGMALLALPLDVQVIHFAPLPAHSHAGNFYRAIVIILDAQLPLL
jgi:hypothetical protein